jgi:hypothetical protein
MNTNGTGNGEKEAGVLYDPYERYINVLSDLLNTLKTNSED